MKKVKKILLLMLSITMCASLLCACKPKDVVDSLPVVGDSRLSACEGEWTAIVSKEDGSDSIEILEDFSEDFTAKIYKEDGHYKIDFYVYFGEGSSLEVYGKKLELKDGYLYGDCENQDWYANVLEKGSENYKATYQMTLLNEDTLEIMLTNEYTDVDGVISDYATHYYFKKSDSDLEAAIDEYRYAETITVSNISELYNAIGDNRRIILKEGTYNFSELTDADRDESIACVNHRCEYDSDGEYRLMYFPDDQIYCYQVKNMIIEGEEGAEVHLCTEDELLAPIAFSGCEHITLRNLKIGHMVEPGLCSGSVTFFTSCSNVDVENCRLYGCGTYGVEAEYSYNINVKDCDIYECSYGLVSFRACSDSEINDCTLRDSESLTMFSFDGGGDIRINNCSITGNQATGWDDLSFISSVDGYGEITFNDCTFKDNKYFKFTTGDNIKFNNCDIEESK